MARCLSSGMSVQLEVMRAVALSFCIVLAVELSLPGKMLGKTTVSWLIKYEGEKVL